MNSYDRVKAVLNGKIPDRVPVNLINFICAPREVDFTVKEAFTDAKKFSYAQLKAQDKYGHDMVSLQTGVVGLAHSLGCEIKYFDSTCPVVVERPYKNYKDFIESYCGLKPDELLSTLIETTKLIVKKIGGNVFIRADCEIGPFSLAGEIFGIDKLLMDLIDENKRHEIKDVLNICSDAIIQLSKYLKKAGAHLTGIGDGLSGPDVISPNIYKDVVFNFHKKCGKYFKKIGLDFVLHICGNATSIIEKMVDTNAIALELDYKINSKKCREATLGKCTIIGNLDPSEVMCNGDPELIMSKAKEAIELFGKDGWFILSPGCDLPYNTPEENMFALVEAAKKYGKYPLSFNSCVK